MTSEPSFFDIYHPEPLLIVISGPSGVGKDAVLQSLKDHHLPFHFVVTATTRDPRPGERDGFDYHFISCQRFEEMIAQDELLEYALVYNQYKGVPKFEIRDALASGKDVIMRLDVQGAAKVHQLCPEAILIFLVPGNEDEWLNRLNKRKTEDGDSLHLRVETARKEMQRINEFDYIVINAQNCLDDTANTIIAIINAEHHRVLSRQISL